MFQRSLLALVYASVTEEPGLQAMFTTLLCLLYVILHMLCAPLHSGSANRMQATLLVCLTVVALCTVPFAEGLEKAVPGTIIYPSNQLALVVGTLCSGVVPLLVILFDHREQAFKMAGLKAEGCGWSGRTPWSLRRLAAVLLVPLVLVLHWGHKLVAMWWGLVQRGVVGLLRQDCPRLGRVCCVFRRHCCLLGGCLGTLMVLVIAALVLFTPASLTG
jgi:hypothetical protein